MGVESGGVAVLIAVLSVAVLIAVLSVAVLMAFFDFFIARVDRERF